MRRNQSKTVVGSDLEPEWLDDVQKNGELFYLELNEGEEEAAMAHSSAMWGLPACHVHFGKKEAEVITDGRRHKEKSKTEPKLKKLAEILRKKRHLLGRVEECGGVGSEGGAHQSHPTSILKNQIGQRLGVVVHQQQLKEVYVHLNPRMLGSWSPTLEKGGLLEALVGMVHCPAWGKGEEGVGEKDKKLAIHGLVPNSPAIKCAQILIGDVLVAIDDVDVTSENIERVLSCVLGPTQVKLTLGRSSPWESPDSTPPSGRPSPPVNPLVKLLCGEDEMELQMSNNHIPHIVMYLTLRRDSDSTGEDQEILYHYPVSEASTQLKGVRGVFLTLSDMLENVTGGQIVSSSLLLNKHLIHVGYWKEGYNLLVLGLPAESVPLLHLKTVIGGVVRTLKVMYGSLDRAFCASENGPRLDHLFCLLFHRLIQPSKLSSSCRTRNLDVSNTLFLDGLPAICWLTLSPEIKVEIDTVLSDFESSDFGEMSEDFFDMRRLYVTLGSCLFYKGYLIANHLPKEDLLDISLYCQHYCLLPVASEKRIGQLVIWREVFPQRRGRSAPKTTGMGYCEPQGRCFLLIVGLRHFMLCVLLEAGGCAAPAMEVQGPDCVYVDQVKATLLQLEGLDESIEEHLAMPLTPCLSSGDWFLLSDHDRDRLDSPAGSPIISKLPGSGKVPSSTGRPIPFGEVTSSLRRRCLSPHQSLLDSRIEGQADRLSFAQGLGPHALPDPTSWGRQDSLDFGGSNGSGGNGSIFKIPRKKLSNPFYLGTLKKSLTGREAEDLNNTMKLTSGAENTLFHYVCMDSVHGIFIAPTHREVSQLSGSIHPHLIRNFHQCCLSIRATFQQSLLFREKRSLDRHQGTKGLGSVKEHGLLFQCKPKNWTDQKKPAPTMTYWVIGYVPLKLQQLR
ncbi:hypothetical protein GJAV_G00162640 [Gymnothorax javanicus]|nr:hypothetical protein GJAV_G00162640 [Gymnothorax javanicus]